MPATPKTTDKVFLNGMSSMANGPGNLFTLGKMQVWGRMINHEPKNLSPADVACFNWEAGARVWIFGGKTETNSNAIRAIGGSRLEVLGFMANQTHFLNTDRTSSVIVYVTDSRVSVSLHSDQIPNRTVGYRNTVKAIDGAVTKQLSFAATPKRPDEAYAVFLPLYVDNI